MASPNRVPMPLQPLLQRLADARANTDALFAKVAPKALYDRPIPERHRLIFYVGHLEAFEFTVATVLWDERFVIHGEQDLENVFPRFNRV